MRVRLKPNSKAIVRFNNQMDEQYFIHTIVQARDRPGPHPKISIKGKDGREIPAFKPPKPAVKIDSNVEPRLKAGIEVKK